MSRNTNVRGRTETEQAKLCGNRYRWQGSTSPGDETDSFQDGNQPEASKQAIQIESTRGMSDYEFEQFLRFNKEILPQLAETVGVQLEPDFVSDTKEWHIPIEDISKISKRLSEQEQLTEFK